MEKQLAQLLRDNYITSDIKAKARRLLKNKASPGGTGLVTPPTINLQTISAEIEKLPVVIITLATGLPKEEIRRLGQWFRQNVHPQVLLEIRQDKKIIGGCQIIWQGIEGDFSLRKKFKKNYEAP